MAFPKTHVDGEVVDAAWINDIETRAAQAVTPERPVASLTQLPTLLKNADAGYNNGPSLTTDGNYEYAVWVDPSGHPMVGQRVITGGPQPDGGGNWIYTDLSATALGTQVADGHNYYAIAVDGDGYIHIAGNMHAVALKYIKSDAPDSIASFSTSSMTGQNEDRSTYPQFCRLANGNLLYAYRNGASGDGDGWVKLYTTSTATWTDFPKLINGSEANENPYLSRLVASQDGTRLGMAFIWRSNGTAPYTINDMCFIQSADGGTTWTSAAGVSVSLPITHSTSPKVLDTAPTGSGMFAGGAHVAFDVNNRPHVVYLHYDAAKNTNVRHSYWDGGAWQHEFVTFGSIQMSMNPPWVNNAAVVDQSVSRPSVFTNSDGGVYVLWRTNGDGKHGVIRLIDVTTPGSPVESVLYNADFGYHEPLFFDTEALALDQLRTLFVPTPYAITGYGDYGDAPMLGAC